MTEHDQPGFMSRVMGPLYLNFGKEPDAALSALYFQALRDLALVDLAKATEEAIQHRTFFPKVAELREIVLGTPEERAAIAWTRAHNAALKGCGTYRPLDFGDPVIHATIAAMGGWAELYVLGFRDAEGVDVAVKRKEFVQLYMIFLRRALPETTPPALACDQTRVGTMPPIKLNELGEVPRKPQKALPDPAAEEPYLSEPPQFFRDMVDSITKARTLQPGKATEQKPAFTADEIAAQEHRKAEKIARLREEGHLPANGDGSHAPSKIAPRTPGSDVAFDRMSKPNGSSGAASAESGA
jgi:hypothetical protein